MITLHIKNGLAYFLATENRDLTEALQLIDEGLEEEPDDHNIIGYQSCDSIISKGNIKKHMTLVLRYEDKITKDDLEKDPTFSYYLGRIKWAVGDTVSAKKYFKYALKQTEPDARGKRDQQELIKFMAEQNM